MGNVGGSPSDRSDKVLRFRVSERRVHWAIAIPFLACYATALILVVVYNPDPLRPYREVVSWIHKISGLCLLLFPTYAILRSVCDVRIHFYNIKQAWVWVLADVKWLLLMGFAAVFKRIQLPEQGKFNAAQKLNFMMVMSTYPIYICTGLVMWISGAALWAWLIHFGMAILATPFILGHIFMATIPSSTRKGLQGMFSGFVDRRWAKHHHRRWFREHFEDSSPAAVILAAERTRKEDCESPMPETRTISGYDVGSRLTPVSSQLEALTGRADVVASREDSMRDTNEGNGGNVANTADATSDGVHLLQSNRLRAIVLGLRSGSRRQHWIAYGRAAMEESAREGDWSLTAGLFRELWPEVRDVNLNREEWRAIIRTFLGQQDLRTAAKAAAVRILQDSRDGVAVDCLMKVAEAALRKRASQDATKIYVFLSRHCADSPYSGYFQRGIELAEEWAGNGSSAPTGFDISLGGRNSETQPDARV
jgi:formate dehydrogenase subunit gamma